MRQAGAEVCEVWREAGEWWAGASPKEFRRIVDGKGRRAVEEELPSLQPVAVPPAAAEDLTEEIVLQKQARRQRDSWSEYRKRGVAEGFYESYKAKGSRKGSLEVVCGRADPIGY